MKHKLISFFLKTKNQLNFIRKEGNFLPSLSYFAKKEFLTSKKAAFLFGCLSVCAFPPYYILPLLFITVSLLMFSICRQTKLKTVFALGYWFGFGHFACGLFWINHALMTDISRLGWLIPLAFIAGGSFFGFFIAFPALLSKIGKTPLTQIICFASFWTIFEWIRSFFLTGFPWNLLGTVWAFSDSAIQFASVFGTYGLSFLTIFLSALPSLLWLKKSKKYRILTLSLCLIIPSFLWGFGTYRLYRYPDTNFSSLKVRVVQPAIAQRMKWDHELLDKNLQTYIDMSKAPSKLFDKPDIIIWGETAIPFVLKFESNYILEIQQAIPENSYLIAGAVDYNFDGQKWRPNNAMHIINQFGVIDSYYKSHLVPFGEYIPLRKYLPERLKPVTNVIADFLSGDGVKTLSLPKVPDFGALICYEVIFPSEISEPNHRPYWLINLTNDGWYGRSAGPYQHLVSAQMRSVEEGLTLVRAANTGISALVSPTGRILKFIGLNENGNLDFFLPANLSIETFYSRYHNLPLLGICLILILGVFIMSYHNKSL